MENESPAGAIANTAQRDYWDCVAGPRWVGLGGFVERRVRAVNDLLLARSQAAAGEMALEIGCGTGAFTVPLAQALGATGEVVGADISEAMLEGARRRIADNGLRNISLICADAQVHGFPPARFDLVVSRFGVMFFADPAAAFRNLLGALRPGGRLCFVCWAALEDNPHWLVSYEAVLRHLGPPAPKPPRAPGPMAYAEPDYVRGFLTEAGFAGIEIRRENPTIHGSSPAEEAQHALVMGPSGRLIDEKKPDEPTRQAIRRDIEAAYAAELRNGKIELAATVFLVTARRP